MSKNYYTKYQDEIHYTSCGGLLQHFKEEPVTPTEEDFGDLSLDYPSQEIYVMRKSLSMNDISISQKDSVKVQKPTNKDDLYIRHRKDSELQVVSKTKFISMAEAIYHYHRDTPDRFHTTKRPIFLPQINRGRSGLTVPHSPILRCKDRSRSQRILSQKEKEDIEIEEMKKYKIKARPIPKCVIKGSQNLPEVFKKPITVPEPFHLTKIPKKIGQLNPEGQVLKFKAHPGPKQIFHRPHLSSKIPPPSTKPVSPRVNHQRLISADHLIRNKNNKSTNVQKPEKCEKTVQCHGTAKLEPFSFEKRDMELKKKREERIKQQMEEERQLATRFKAQPLPAAVKKRSQIATSSNPSDTSSENKENQSHYKFEAKPPVVLNKAPFKPVLQSIKIKPIPFDLTTEKRAIERKNFDKKLKEKEEKNYCHMQQEKRKQMEAEEKANAQFRTKLVHHAKPVPDLKPFIPVKSVAPITVPETPELMKRMNKN